jgi:hypothetical protein
MARKLIEAYRRYQTLSKSTQGMGSLRLAPGKVERKESQVQVPKEFQDCSLNLGVLILPAGF